MTRSLSKADEITFESTSRYAQVREYLGEAYVIKGDMAIGWKGFFSDAEDLIEAVEEPQDLPARPAHAARGMVVTNHPLASADPTS